MKVALLGVLCASLGFAQTALLSGKEAAGLAQRVTQLMESAGAILPELQLASAPVVAGAKNAAAALARDSGNALVTAEFVRRTRAFLSIADSTPKPFPFSDTAKNQLAELRGDCDRLETHFAALIAEKEMQLRTGDPDNLKRYAEENTRVMAPGANQRVVFLGDSITDFWHLNEYFTGRDFINRGISGQITSQMLGRFKADVIDLHPKAVLILAGTNDIARGTALDIIENNIIMMSDLARAHLIKVLIASVLPVSQQQATVRSPQKIQQLNTWLQNFCAQTSCIYVDYFAKVRDGYGNLQTDLADDGLHPNGKGYRIMAPVALAAIDRAVGTVSNAPLTPRRRVKLF